MKSSGCSRGDAVQVIPAPIRWTLRPENADLRSVIAFFATLLALFQNDRGYFP